MRRIKNGSRTHLSLCQMVCDRAHKRTLESCQKHGVNVREGSDYWDELYDEKWHEVHDEVFAQITLVPE